MDLENLTEILSKESGNKFCPYCGTPYKPRHQRQRTCGSAECKRLHHNKYMREYSQRLKEKDIELWRKRHRDAQRRSRAKKRGLIYRDNQLKRESKEWKRQEEFDKKIQEYGLNYGEVQAKKLLEKIPKIDVTLGEKK